MRINCRASSPAPDAQIISEVRDVLERRGALKHPPLTLSVSDAVARGIAGLFTSLTPSGMVLGDFFRTGTADSTELIEAARTEQGYASPEGHAALYCLIGWVRARVYQRVGDAALTAGG
jgi:hypothetical protein